MRSPRPVLWCSFLAVAVLLAGCSGSNDGDAASGGGEDGEQPPSRVTAYAAPSTARLTPRVGVGELERTASLASARGEREGAQIVITSDRGSPRVVVSTTALTGPGGAVIAPQHVHTYLQQVLTVKRGSPAGRSGKFADPLVPAEGRDVVVAPGSRLLAWVDIATPLTAKPGSYAGAVEVRSSTRNGRVATGTDGLLATVPIDLEVHAATLPARPTLRSSIGVDASQLIRFEDVEPGSTALRDVFDRYAKTLAAARLSIADVGVFVPGTVPGTTQRAGDAAYLRRVFNRRGVSSVRIPFYFDSPFADPINRDRPAALRYLRAAAAWLRKEGMLERAYVYAIDEPDASRAGEVRELRELMREADPGLKLLLTREFGAKEFRGNVDIWVPNVSAKFRAADVSSARRTGADTWWYPSVTTWQPYPDLFVDELRPAPRALGWLAWRYGVQGMLYWSATHWHEVKDPYRDSATYRESDAVGNGDGVLLYPGKPVGQQGVPAPSVRLFQVRDGHDDHDLFVMATCVGSAAEAAQLRTLVAGLAPSMTSFSPRATDVTAVRTRALAIIDRDPQRATACAQAR